MPRRPNVIPSVKLTLMLPEDIKARLDLELFSQVEGVIPRGAYQDFFCKCIREYFELHTLALQAYGLPQGYFVKGHKDMLIALKAKLEGASHG